MLVLYIFICCFSFLLFLNLKSLIPFQPLLQWAANMRSLPLSFWKDFIFVGCVRDTFSGLSSYLYSALPSSPKMADVKEEKVEEMSILELPDLALECILEKLPPDALFNMAGVCTSLRERCLSDHLWERHLKQKWGQLVGATAYKKWQCHVATKKDMGTCEKPRQKGLMRFLSMVWPFSWTRPKVVSDVKYSRYDCNQRSALPVDSVMSWYLALETGAFVFPGQVYNRENGHVGFMLSCYDADLSYDSRTDTFQARYPPHGRRVSATETGVTWARLRGPPLDTSPRELHISDCLNDLRPGDHIEIQWRRNKEFPYGWWYGVVGHLESCDGNEIYCRCHQNNDVVLEFLQYTPGSRWRKTTISRKDHREEGNEADGFYGGIRKLNELEEISRWKKLWPTGVLE